MSDKPTEALLGTRFNATERQALDSIDLALKLRLIDVGTAIQLSDLIKQGRLEDVYKRLS